MIGHTFKDLLKAGMLVKPRTIRQVDSQETTEYL